MFSVKRCILLFLVCASALRAQPEYQSPEGQEKPAPAEESKPEKQPEQKADLIGFQNMIAGSGNLTFFLGKFGKLKLGYWDIRKEQLQDGWYDANGALKSGESTESFSNTRYGTVDASGYRAAAYLRRQLLKEYELVYSVNWRRLEIGVGYSRVHAGDSIREIKDDTLNFANSRRMKFDPRADFGYLMLTMVF